MGRHTTTFVQAGAVGPTMSMIVSKALSSRLGDMVTPVVLKSRWTAPRLIVSLLTPPRHGSWSSREGATERPFPNKLRG